MLAQIENISLNSAENLKRISGHERSSRPPRLQVENSPPRETDHLAWLQIQGHYSGEEVARNRIIGVDSYRHNLGFLG